ncbi:MAG: YgiQ family radical SAM protein, partial [Bacteroidales bacterium]
MNFPQNNCQFSQSKRLPLSAWMPITRKEIQDRGWDEVDIVIVSGDAYIDHPSFGAAVIGRVLEHQGYKVALIPQPNWQDDLRDFKKFGKPRLFFGITAGSMDSMVNHYTANKRLRSDDAYTPGGEAGFRPDYPTIVYSQILKKIYPDTPIILGGIEASLRRITHYDYWQDQLRPSILKESGADILVYGMGEQAIVNIAKVLDSHAENKLELLHTLPQLAYLLERAQNVLPTSQIQYLPQPLPKDIILASHEKCLKDKIAQITNFRMLEEESNKILAGRIFQQIGIQTLVINPPYTFTDANTGAPSYSIDQAFDLPYTRLPHPKYKKRGEIPAYTMIRHSINIHRGCFGGCAFCTISAHQGKQIQSRSEASILKELEVVVQMDDFKGYISDLGGPSANMYAMQGVDQKLCQKCKRASCIFPTICPNLHNDHTPLLSIYKKVAAHPAVKKCFIGSGVRYDMLLPYLSPNNRPDPIAKSAQEYATYLIKNNVSGRLKVAP